MPERLPLIAEPAAVHAFLKTHREAVSTYPVCIVDLCSEHTYRHGHIEGAISIPVGILMSGQPPAAGKIASQDQLSRLFSYLGTTSDTHFIVYDDEGGGWAGRFVWTLDVIGHKHVTVIDGGLIAWQGDDLPLVTEPFSPEPENYPVTIDSTQIVTAQTIVASLGAPDFAIWYARSRAEYTGMHKFAARGGHIPGATHCEWTTLMDPARNYRIRTDAKAHLDKLGLNAEKNIVTHCQSHHRSGYTYLVGKYLGLNIKAYDGSWSEWGNTDGLPIEGI